MIELDPGHEYSVDEIDAKELYSPQIIRFVKRMGDKYPGNENSYSGTNMQELIRILIARTLYLNNQIPNILNLDVLFHARMMLFALEQRAAERHGLLFKFYSLVTGKANEIEKFSTCEHCGHIVCKEFV